MSGLGPAAAGSERSQGGGGGEVQYDPNMQMLNSQTVRGAPRQTRVYRQVRTDAHEYFAEVKTHDGLLTRLWPWRQTGGRARTPWNSEDRHLTPPQRASESLCNFGTALGSFVSGVLGGMAVMTLMQIYLFNINSTVNGNDLVLVYYAPIALTVNRIYWGLTMIALASAVSRSAWMTIVLMPSEQSHESLRFMAEAIQSLALPTWSMLAVMAYLLAFVLNIASSGNDSELAYAVSRDPLFQRKSIPNEFRRRLVSWRAINTVKCILLLVAWVSVCKLPHMVVLEWQPRTLARFARQVAQESSAHKIDHSGHHEFQTAFDTTGVDNRTREHSAFELQQMQSKWKDTKDANKVDSPRINTNPVFQPVHSSRPMTMHPSAADGMRS